MRTLSRVLVAAAIGALAAPALAGAAQTAAGTKGIVVQRDAKAGVVVIATRSGKLQRVTMAKPNGLAMGTVVRVVGSKVSIVGHAHRAKLRGVVVRRHSHSFALAGNGSVLAVTSPTPPPAGQQVTATVQVTPTELDDDDGNVQVNDTSAPSAELRGTVISQDATSLLLAVNGFPSGLSIALGSQTIPTLVAGTPVEARVVLGPDPANPKGIVLTLVSLKVEDGQNNQNEHHGDGAKAEGKVTAITEAGPLGFEPGSITIADEHGMVTFVIPAGFGATGVVVGDEVEARGTPATTPGGQPTLTRLESKSDNNDNGNGNGGGGGDDGGDGGNSGHGSGGDN
jgi:hypothetical protein